MESLVRAERNARQLKRIAIALLSGMALMAFTSTSLHAKNDPDLKKAVVAGYARLVSAAYDDAVAAARELASSIDGFLAAPDETTLARARQAWIAARIPYTQTEAFRFYDGPIEAVEGRINSWPIDENLIDYVDDDPAAGIINQPTKYPNLTAGLLASLNERDGEKNITTGFHAIEFLLWGQDLNDAGPGRRSFLDYVVGKRPNADRRREYLRITSQLLVEDLSRVAMEWAPGQPSNYRSTLIAMPPDEALTCILKGIGVLSGSELAGERLTVPYETKEQEDEHSCFSDNTHADILFDTVGIENVYLGRYVRRDGERIEVEALHDLLARVDAALADKLTQQMNASVAAARLIPAPFDRAIAGVDTAPGRVAVKRLINALRSQADSLAMAGAALGLKLNF